MASELQQDLQESLSGAAEAAVDAVGFFVRLGVRAALVPTLALPQEWRNGVLEGARSAVAAAAALPRALARLAADTAGDIDALRAESSRREDLGSRLRRERRRSEAGSEAP